PGDDVQLLSSFADADADPLEPARMWLTVDGGVRFAAALRP
ncbi:MAG: hypothetical protein JWL73_3473, partial [Actinomycetia bacterium]|nr:hypothetical protein [Actinomycetes bacterium]